MTTAFHASETISVRHTYGMRTWDDETAEYMEEWIEKEVRAAIGASPKAEGSGAYKPSGRHAWFAYVMAEVVAPLALRQLADAWKDRPPYPDWQHHASELRKHADEQMLVTQLPSGTTLAEWYSQNEALLQQDPSSQEWIRIVADALLPVFNEHPGWWAAIECLDGDFSRGTFSELLANWHACAPEKCRAFIRAIAGEFGLAVT